ncbi:ABC transporter permease [Endozoicomonas gorgoniicola]|uniref:ABC transporter permease n=1 Tax=Endozoicomonas gorgoniicola TaxID=1234144 RepID=A0ABT3MQP3_9GAMM|nr:ABC transporter permease [Endozoicomonas gorgoniicola]MCW7551692.1 ABC transporter permease [Endozoicomonas gorgoniicola]
MNAPAFLIHDSKKTQRLTGNHYSSSCFELSGDWVHASVQPYKQQLSDVLKQEKIEVIYFSEGKGFRWDSGTMAFILSCQRLCQRYNCTLDVQQLPDDIQSLLKLATSVPPNQESNKKHIDYFQLFRQGLDWIKDWLRFSGEVSLSVQKMIRGRSDARWSDGINFLHQAGPSAVPIVTLLSFLVGMILAYLGTVQLRQFGVEVYVANLVGLGMVREMGALMTGIIMAGRTGASYAAQLGTMQVNEEIDALTTLGIKPVDYLVLPRMLALIVAMPLLTIYSNILGMLGGAMVAISMDITPRMYYFQLSQAFSMADLTTGVFKSIIFGGLIGFAGCHAGLRCGRSSAAVGQATMSAVVTAVVYLVVADAVLNILYFHLGI